ncbi:ORF38 [White spot syndrome virus]|uniref:Wsv458 n=3 Tax=White spot syndrome virus TaxID=342409 RepID=Q8VAG0_WSSVS|nr:wsv458 [Shrimp white spot syndrome virus]AFX59835.1 wsv458 [White spot syndrome virus]AAL33459.1 wsv458 [Shrimp white spot syndrome virus]AAL89386.1 WSSV518 [Shrimp white spot syndrome virus]ATU84085.1 ORF38 [White spot syndrome virus]AWQ60580.1 wsv458 [Shrimp white spot syndrome virus]
MFIVLFLLKFYFRYPLEYGTTGGGFFLTLLWFLVSFLGPTIWCFWSSFPLSFSKGFLECTAHSWY